MCTTQLLSIYIFIRNVGFFWNWFVENYKPPKNSVYLICPFSFYNYKFEFTLYLYITFLYTRLRPILGTHFGKIVFYESHVKKQKPMVVQVYRRKKIYIFFSGSQYNLKEFNIMLIWV